MNASVLLVSDHEGLSRSRVAILKGWNTVAVNAAQAPVAITAKAYDLLIICQTISYNFAAKLAQQMIALHPTAKVLTINGQVRRFGTVQYTVEMTNPSWLPNAVCRTLSGETPYATINDVT